MKKFCCSFLLILAAWMGFATDVTVYVGAYLGTEPVFHNSDASLTDPRYKFSSNSGTSQTITVNPPLGWKVVYWKKVKGYGKHYSEFKTGVLEMIDDQSTSIAWSHSMALVDNYKATIAAQLEPITYNIEFSSGISGASGQMAAMTDLSYTNNEVQLTQNAFTCPGRSFKCWLETSPGTGKVFSDLALVGGEALSVSNDDETVTLTAQWTNCTYRVTFDPCGGSVSPSCIDVTYSGKYPALPTPSLNGSTFAGWYTAAEGGYKVEEGDTVDITCATTLYAHWDTVSYTMTLKKKGNGTLEPSIGSHEYGYGTSVEVTATPATGYLFKEWEEDQSTENPRTVQMTADQSLTAVFTAKVYAVTFAYRKLSKQYVTEYVDYSNAATPPSQEEVDQYPGHTFSKWDSYEYENVTMDMTINALYDANIYWVNYDANAADATGSMAIQEMECGTEKALKANSFTRPGYAFVCWNTQKDGSGDEYQNKEKVSDLSLDDGAVVTLYAQWDERSYAVKFDANGGEGTMSDQKMFCGISSSLSSNKFTRVGYTFSGWATNATEKAVFADGASVTDLAEYNESTTLYATWQANNYYIRFDRGSHGKGDAMAVQSFVYDQSQALCANTYEEDSGIGLWAFGGWTNLETDVGYADCEVVSNLTAVKDATNVLTAVWLDNRTIYSKALKCESMQWYEEGTEVIGLYNANYRWFDSGEGLAITGTSHYVLTTTISNAGMLSFRCRNTTTNIAIIGVQCGNDIPSVAKATTNTLMVTGDDWVDMRFAVEAGRISLFAGSTKIPPKAWGLGLIEITDMKLLQPQVPGEEISVPSDTTASEFAASINSGAINKGDYLKAPDDVATSDAYLSYFDAVPSSDTKISFVLNADGTNAVEEAANVANTNALAVAFSTTVKEFVVANPLIGFYYSFKQGAALSELDFQDESTDKNLLAGRDKINFTVIKPSESGFYQTLVTPSEYK